MHRPARDFARWWDGGDGDETARNLVVADTDGQYLAARDLHSPEESS
ncbi:hypothetical protein ACH4S8_35135 [Streptomyces sp. NPDC021080]